MFRELNIIKDEEVDLPELILDDPNIIQDEKEEEKVELPELIEKCALDTHRNTLPKAKAKEDSDEEVLKLRRKQIAIDKAPFTNFLISDSEKLNTVMGRKRCERCHRSRKFFCYTCCLPVIDRSYFPRVKLPIKIDIVKHSREISGKSTAIHAVILAPEDVKIYEYPQFPEILDKEKTILIFPSETAICVEDLFTKEKSRRKKRERFPIKQAIFIDSTWPQSKEIFRDIRFRELRCVFLRSRISQFWRHQQNSPRWYLSTIEAIHQFLMELHTQAFGAVENYADLAKSKANDDFHVSTSDNAVANDEKYNGQYDDLLYFFKFMYNYIHCIYEHDELLAYKRRL